MPEIYPDPHRAEIARILDSMETEVIEDEEIHHADLVRELENSKHYTGRPFTGEDQDGTGGSPRHWRILIPSRASEHGLRAIEFGLSAKDMSGLSRTESAFEHRRFLDKVVDANEINPAVRYLYANMGGFAVQAARNAEHRIFSALELRYKPDEHSHDNIRYAYLYYSKVLLGVARYIKLTPKRNYPEWLHQAADSRNGEAAAEAVALGALLMQRRAQQQLQ